MNYTFPEINNVADVLHILQDREEFFLTKTDGYLVVNYHVNFEDTFPTPNTNDEETNRDYALRRELRGIIFDAKSGIVLARRYHKFFNVNEKDETQIQKIDLSQPHVILEKLDGSMITPFIVDGGVQWGTKMGHTEVSVPVYDFVAQKPQYAKLAVDLFIRGFTPIFEWCTPKNRIVINYDTDRLVLTAVRNNQNGLYISYDEMIKLANKYDIDVVSALPGNIQNLEEFMAKARDLEGQEGYVIRFDNGHMLKVKGEWYVRIHKTKENLSQEKNLVSMFVHDTVDDAKAFMLEEDRHAVERFESDFWHHVMAKADELKWVVIAAKDNLNDSRKRFALEVANEHPAIERGILFKIWQGEDAIDAVVDIIKRNVSTSTKLANVRELFGNINWMDYINIPEE